MLQTINGIDLILSLVILGLGFIISMQRQVLKETRLDLSVERIHTEMLEFKLEQLEPPF